MSSRSIWRGLHELVDAKEAAKSILREIEELHKCQRMLSAAEIKMHAMQLADEIDNIIAKIREDCDKIIENIENHKKKLIAKQKFITRHYRLK
jgi:thiamine kinase-like enzyme